MRIKASLPGLERQGENTNDIWCRSRSATMGHAAFIISVSSHLCRKVNLLEARMKEGAYNILTTPRTVCDDHIGRTSLRVGRMQSFVVH